MDLFSYRVIILITMIQYTILLKWFLTSETMQNLNNSVHPHKTFIMISRPNVR